MQFLRSPGHKVLCWVSFTRARGPLHQSASCLRDTRCSCWRCNRCPEKIRGDHPWSALESVMSLKHLQYQQNNLISKSTDSLFYYETLNGDFEMLTLKIKKTLNSSNLSHKNVFKVHQLFGNINFFLNKWYYWSLDKNLSQLRHVGCLLQDCWKMRWNEQSNEALLIKSAFSLGEKKGFQSYCTASWKFQYSLAVLLEF